MAFRDRSDAGQQLARTLASYRERRPVILALPRGGVPVAAEVAAALSAELDLILVRKIGVPWRRELAMGAVVDGGNPIVVRNDDVIDTAGVPREQFDAACRRELAEIERRRRLYVGARSPVDITGRVAVVVDDGIATGATTRAALQATRARKPARLVLAVPVGPTGTMESLRADADDVVCLERHEDFGAVGLFYDDFTQVTDDEVIEIMRRFHGRCGGQARQPAA
jgi:predicted phosphoribosyltransferase